MSFALSLSGLNGASRAIDVISDNIANSQTIGFKSSKARFADVYASSMRGTTSMPSGVSAAVINQQFTQGGLMQSESPLDMAITGQGFFRLDKDGDITYSRDGQFQLSFDAEDGLTAVLVNRGGLGVTGYPAEFTADPRGVIVTTAAPQPISFDLTMPAAATSSVTVGATLDARLAPPTVVPFAPDDAMTYSNTSALAVFDSTGASHELRMYFVKSAPGNLWDVYSTVDDAAQAGPVNLSFDTRGAITTPMPLPAQTYALSGGESLSIALDFSGAVQYGRPFSVDSLSQDGYAEGVVDDARGVGVGADGVINASYTNGQSRKVGQVVLANFVNPDALISLGDSQWMENPDPVSGSGTEILDTPGRTDGDKPMGLGAIQGGAKEQSNVDLSTELVALIEQQRNYQASAQTFKILDQILQNLGDVR